MKRYGLLLLAVVLLLLAGCSQQVQTSQVKPKAPADVTTINWYYFPAFAPRTTDAGSYEQTAIQKFQAAHPGIKVNPVPVNFETGPDKLEYALEKGLCDVILDAPGRIVAYGRAGKMLTLNKLFDEQLRQGPGNKWSWKPAALMNGCIYIL